MQKYKVILGLIVAEGKAFRPRCRGRIAFGADASQVGQKNLNTLGTIRSEKYERIAANATYFSASAPVRVWLKGVNYPGSRYGESEFLFGPNIGVRPNPPLTLELGAGYTF